MRELSPESFRLHLAGLNAEPGRWVVGYSGGADSAALVHLLAQLELDFVAAHLHHGQRQEADEELNRAAEFCQSLNVPFLSGKADVPALAKERGIGLEEAGREARYTFLRQAAFRTESKWVATAHTRTDHIETILFHALRGTGLAGLAGIRPTRDDLIRPLLPFDRAATRAYCAQNGLWFHDDPANEDLRFARSRLRAKVLPELGAIHPGYEASLERLAELAHEEDRFLDGVAAAALERAEHRPNGDLSFLTEGVELSLDLAILRAIPPVPRRRALRIAFEFVGADLDFDQTRALFDRVSAKEPGSVTATGGLAVAEWTHSNLYVRRTDIARPARFPLQFPGETSSDLFGWVIEAEIQPHPLSVAQPRRTLIAHFPLDRLKPPLHIRAIEPGDRLTPLGFEGTRKVSDLLGEAHLTEAARIRIPLIADLVGPLWIPGVCLDARAAQATDASKVLKLVFGPTPSP